MNTNGVRDNARRVASVVISLAMVFSLAIDNGRSSYAEQVRDLTGSITKVLLNNTEGDVTVDPEGTIDIDLSFDVSEAGDYDYSTTMDYTFPSLLSVSEASEATLKVTAKADDADYELDATYTITNNVLKVWFADDATKALADASKGLSFSVEATATAKESATLKFGSFSRQVTVNTPEAEEEEEALEDDGDTDPAQEQDAAEEDTSVDEEDEATDKTPVLNNNLMSAKSASNVLGSANDSSGSNATSADMSAFLESIGITSAEYDETTDDYTVKKGKTYNIFLTFKEDSTKQFDMSADSLTYQIPGDVDVMADNGSLDITVTYVEDGVEKTATVSGNTYTIDENGLVTLTWNKDDPNWSFVENANDLEFKIGFGGRFTESKSAIQWGDSVKTGVTIDDNASVSISKSGYYNASDNKIHYTLTIVSTGEFENVNFSDTINGAALTYDKNAKFTSSTGSTVTPTNFTEGDKGFSGTIASMSDGETIKIEYTASVNLNNLTGAGKTEADTGNAAKITYPGGGEETTTHHLQNEIDYDGMTKTVTGQETDDDGNEVLTWSFKYNEQNNITWRNGDYIKDSISASSASIMSYDTSTPITVNVKDASGNTVATRTLQWSDVLSTDTSFVYTIPASDYGKNYSYEMVYKTKVDMSNVGSKTQVVNEGTDGRGNGTKGTGTVGEDITVSKEMTEGSSESVSWKSTFTVPDTGLNMAEAKDTLPTAYINGKNYYDTLAADTLKVTGLVDGESYEITYYTDHNFSTTTTDQSKAVAFKVTFYYTENGVKKNGLKGTGSKRTIEMTYTSSNDSEWIKLNSDDSVTLQDYQKKHTNTINVNGTTATAFYQPGKSSQFKKTAIDSEKPKGTVTIDGETVPYWEFQIDISDFTDSTAPVTIDDIFDTSLFHVMTVDEMKTYKPGGWSVYYNKILRLALCSNTFASGDNDDFVSVTNTDSGATFVVTQDNYKNWIAAQGASKNTGTGYFTYYLVANSEEAVKTIASNSASGEYCTNKVGDDDVPIKYEYKSAEKVIDNYDSTTGKLTNVTVDNVTYSNAAKYTIVLNPDALQIGDDDTLTAVDKMTNLVVYSNTIKITPSEGVTTNVSDDGATITFTIPNATKVTITYVAAATDADISNEVTLLGYTAPASKEVTLDNVGAGSASQLSFQVLKYSETDNTALKGAVFDLYYTKDDADKKQNSLGSYTTNDNGVVSISSVQNSKYNGEAGGSTSTNLWADHTYYLRETTAPTGYQSSDEVIPVTITKTTSKMDIANHVYLKGYTLSIGNEEQTTGSLTVSKSVKVINLGSEITAGDLADGTYKFKVYSDSTCKTVAKDADGNDVGEISLTVKDGASTSTTVTNLKEGTYYVKEESSTNANVTLVTTPVAVKVEVSKTAEVKTASFENVRYTGGLKVKKSVTVNGAAVTDADKTLADGTYTFRVYSDAKCTTVAKDANGNTVSDLTVKVENGVTAESSTLSKLNAGTYYVKEISSTNANMTLVSEAKEVKVTTGSTATVSSTEFTNNRNYGSLKITKNVTLDGATTTGKLLDGDYYFNITDKDGKAVKDIDGNTVGQVKVTISGGKSATVTVDRLYPGTYKVTEVTTGLAAKFITAATDNVTVTLADTAKATTTASITNDRVTGGLKIKKNVKANGGASEAGTLLDGTYTFKVYSDEKCTTIAKDASGTAVSDLTVTVKNGVSAYSNTLTNLNPGTYYVKETASSNTNVSVVTTAVKVTVPSTGTAASRVQTAEFTNDRNFGSLSIKKSVTLNGVATTTKLADGTYTFTIKDSSGNPAKDIDGKDVSSQTITITSGQSNTVTVNRLAPGTYTITEDTTGLAAKFISLTSSNNVSVTIANTANAKATEAAFTNDRKTGSLNIKKNVTVNGAAVTEDDKTIADGTYTFKVYSDSTCKTVATDASGTAVGDIKVTVTNGVTATSTTITNLNPGTYYVKEESSTNANMTLVTDAKAVTITGGSTATVQTAEFTNNRNTGGLKVEKSVTINGAAVTDADKTLADGTYTFNVYTDKACTKAATKANGTALGDITVTVTNGVTATSTDVKGLTPGTYFVKETKSTNANMTLVKDPVEIKVEGGATATVATAKFTNNRNYGALKITKNVTVNSKATTSTKADGDYYFSITDEKGNAVKDIDGNTVANVKITITNGASNSATVNRLYPGKYIVKELTDKSTNKNVVLTGSADGIELEVVSNTEKTVPTATFTNNMTVGGLTISKSVTVNGEGTTGDLADGKYYFTITDTDGNAVKDADGNAVAEVELEIENGASASTTVTNLIPGKYLVKENTDKSTNKNVSLVGTNGITVEVGANVTTAASTASFVNNRDTGGLIIKKAVTLNGAATKTKLVDGDYTFNLYTDKDGKSPAKDASGNEVKAITINISDGVMTTKEADRTIANLNAGTYYVKETGSDNDDVTLVTDALEVKVTAGAKAEKAVVTVTNNRDTGGLNIKKNVTINGKAVTEADKTLADGTYTFTVYSDDKCTSVATDANGKELANIAVKVENGVSALSDTITNLNAGTYYVKEINSTNANMTLVEDAVAVTIEAGKDATVKTAEFTNNRNYGALKITKNVTVNSRTTTGKLADGKYYFNITDLSGNAVKDVDGSTVAQVEIEIQNGVSVTRTVNRLIPGDCLVTEATAKATNTYAKLIGDNGLKVTVEDNTTATVQTAAFTNNRDTGSLMVEKQVTLNGEATTSDLTDGDYTFTIYSDAAATIVAKDADGADVKAITITIKDGVMTTADADRTVSNLNAGTYYVKETAMSNSYMKLTTKAIVAVDVQTGTSAKIDTALFINNRDTGALKVAKNVTLNGEATTDDSTDGTYRFTIYSDKDCTKIATDADGNQLPDIRVTVKDGVMTTAEEDRTVSNLNAGTYYVKETGSDNQYMSLTSAEVAEITVEAGTDATIETATFTNNRNTGALKITKHVKLDGGDTTSKVADGEYTFRITNEYGGYAVDLDGNTVDDVVIKVEDGKSNTVTVDNLLPGTYYIDEIGSTNEAMSLITDNHVKVVIEDKAVSDVPTAEFTNNRNTGSFELKKVVTINGGAITNDAVRNFADGVYWFTLTDEDGNPVYDINGKRVEDMSLEIKDGRSTKLLVTDLIPGTYILSEDESRSTNTYMSLVGENGLAITITDEHLNLGEVTFTNNRDIETQTDITFEGVKSMDGRALQTGDNFTYTITDQYGNIAGRGTSDESGVITYDTITYTDKQLGTHTYTVREDKVNAHGVVSDTRSYTVTVNVAYNAGGKLVATASDNAKALNFTNTYKAEGSATITGTKTLFGRALTDREFSFTVTDAAGTLLTTITHDASGKIAYPTFKYVVNPAAEAGTAYDAKTNTITVTVNDLADLADSYDYVIAEVEGEDANVLNDTNTYTITATVTENDGHLDVVMSQPTGVDFTNTTVIKDVTNGTTSLNGQTVRAGDTLTYTITFVNTKGDKATAVVSDTIADIVAYAGNDKVTGAEISGITRTGQHIEWQLANIAKGARVTLTFDVLVLKPTQTTLFTNTAYVDGAASNPVSNTVPSGDVAGEDEDITPDDENETTDYDDDTPGEVAGEEEEIVDTGDASPVIPSIVTIILSMLGLVALIADKRKHA